MTRYECYLKRVGVLHRAFISLHGGRQPHGELIHERMTRLIEAKRRNRAEFPNLVWPSRRSMEISG